MKQTRAYLLCLLLSLLVREPLHEPTERALRTYARVISILVGLRVVGVAMMEGGVSDLVVHYGELAPAPTRVHAQARRRHHRCRHLSPLTAATWKLSLFLLIA